ncbi:MAG: DUF4013 domain-containing protein [Anaerolineales bacterium]|nr:DUF4013 domain-containing protein [Anaerolineales bacterium]
MDVSKSFRYVFDDKRWVGKLGIGALITIFVVTIPLLVGWMIGIVRNVMNDDETPMPEWTDWGKLFMDGLKIIVAQFVYTLPIWVIMCIGLAATGALSELSGGGGSDALGTLGAVTIGLMVCLLLLVSIALFFLSPAIVIQYVLSGDEFGACFRLSEVWAIARDNIANILIVFLVSMALGFIISLVTSVLAIIPCIGWVAAVIISILAGPYTAAVTGHLYGQIADQMDNIAPKFT